MNVFRRIWNYYKNAGDNMRALPRILEVLIDNYFHDHLFNNPKYQNEKRLNKYEYKVYSQNGEDGIIDNIFKRIGTTNKFFVEFGVGDGNECNTSYLLLKGWSGLWMEADETHTKSISTMFRSLIQKKILVIKQEFITAENIENLFNGNNVPHEFDLLSIDIDGNDYWVWKTIENFSPRVVVIEYNAIFPPDTEWIMKYNPRHIWNYTSYHGASLKSLVNLGVEKGYSLIGCNFTGVNAFFVRDDLINDRFFQPFTAKNHYEPHRYQLKRRCGHPREFGEFVQ